MLLVLCVSMGVERSHSNARKHAAPRHAAVQAPPGQAGLTEFTRHSPGDLGPAYDQPSMHGDMGMDLTR